MNNEFTETTNASTSDPASFKPGPKLYAGIATLLLIVVAAIIIGPKLWREAPVKAAAARPVVSVSQPLQRELHGRFQFLGQFSAVEQVELRAQVGGNLAHIGFKDGDIVNAGALLFDIDPTQYQIKLSQATAQVERAHTQAEKARAQVENARAQVERVRVRLELAASELTRAQTLRKTEAGTVQNVEQRSAEQQSAQAAFNEAQAFVREAEAAGHEADASGHEADALVRDARFDLDHCRVTAPFTGRMGTHLVSVGNLVSGNRGGGSATTLLATIVSIDPIYLNFDMSEADYLNFERELTSRKSALANKVDISLSDESRFDRRGSLNFLDNTLDRASGTIHARATVPNSDLLLTPGAFGRVRVNLSSSRQVLLVPDAAVSADQTDRMVLVVGPDSVVKEKKVQTGDLRYGLRAIYSGLDLSDRVVIGGPPVAPGAKVSAKDGVIAIGSDEGSN